MLNIQYLRYILNDQHIVTQTQFLIEYCALRGFETCIFQPQISTLNQTDHAFINQMQTIGWNDFDIAQWIRYGFDCQADLVQRITNSPVPFAFKLEELEHCWHKRRDFSVIRQLFKRRGLNTGVIVPIHLPQNNIGYAVWFSKQCYDLSPFVHKHQFELDAVCRCFHRIYHNGRYTNEPSSIGLSQKEWKCLSLAACGLTEKEMAEQLVRSADTVKFHLRNAAKKLNAKNRTEAVAKAVKLGVIHLVPTTEQVQ